MIRAASEVLDALACAGGWIEPPNESSAKWRVFEPRSGLPEGLRQEIRDQWIDVKAEALRRQREAFEAARAAAFRHGPFKSSARDRQRAIDVGCIRLLKECLDRGVGVPEAPSEMLITANALLGVGLAGCPSDVAETTQTADTGAATCA